jgi:cyclin-A
MKKDKSVSSKAGEVPVRLTRARVAALSATGELPPLKDDVAQESQKHPQGTNSERAVSDDTCLPRKKRAALEDVTNIYQAKKTKLTKPDQLNVSTKVPSVSLEDNAPSNLIGGQTSEPSAQPLISQAKGFSSTFVQHFCNI